MESKLRIEIRLGDLTEQNDVDAIVNPTNDYLMLSGTIGGAIRKRGGDAIDREAQSKGQIALGEAVHTSAGKLPFRHIIHAAVIGLRPEDLQVKKRPGSATSGDIIGAATLNALDLANFLGLMSIAFPPLGVADADFPPLQCADVMLNQIRAFGSAHPDGSLKRVVIVAPDQATFQMFNGKTIQQMAS
jgi:O-acetyl-ADP-ribose deacetylase (regulator of RNase III)